MAAFTVARLPNRLIPSAPSRKKVDVLLGPDGKPILSFFGVPNSVNTISVTNAPTGTGPTIAAVGETNTDLNLVAPGTGVVKADGDEVVTLTGTQTQTNKKLTTPIVDSIKDTNGNTALELGPTTSAVNYMYFKNGAAGGSPYMQPHGTDANLNMVILPKGSGAIRLEDSAFANVLTTALGVASAVNYVTVANAATATAPSISANGSDTNVDLNLLGRGTGVVKAGGVEVVTLTGAQTQTNKTLTDPKISSAIKDSNGNNIISLSPTASAVNYLQVVNGATAGAVILRAVGSDTNVDINFQPQAAGGVRINGVAVVTSTNTQTLTNKVVQTSAATTSLAGLRIPHGAAPTSPVDGDMWSTTAGLSIRINGVTKTVTLT